MPKVAIARSDREESSDSSYGSVSTLQKAKVPAVAPKANSESTLNLLRDERIRGVLTAGFLLSFTYAAYETIWVLWAYTPLSLGGLQRTPSEIGYVLAFTGALGIGLSLLAYPALNARFGTLRLYTYTMSLWSVVFIIIPSMIFGISLLDGHPKAMGILIWTGLGLMTVIARTAFMSFSSNMIMVKSAAPNKESLGATFGLSQSVGCVARASAPAFASSLFALSVDKQILKGYFVWIILLFISFAGIVRTKNLKQT